MYGTLSIQRSFGEIWAQSVSCPAGLNHFSGFTQDLRPGLFMCRPFRAGSANKRCTDYG
jgi:hypothetical protein